MELNTREIMHTCTYVVQGLEKSWETHRKCAEMLWEGAEKLGLELLVQEKVCEGNKIILRSQKNALPSDLYCKRFAFRF